MDIKNQEIIDHLGQMQGPIPGQSLTADPDNPYPWEQPPKHTTLNGALHSLFDFMTEEETYMEIVTGLGEGMPVVNLTETILQDGFQKGAWNPDLMIQLVEPTMYMVMSMAEKAGVKYRVDDEDNPDLEDAAPQDELESLQELNKIARENITTENPASKLPQEIQEELQQMEVPESLLSPTETPELTEETNSLLARG